VGGWRASDEDVTPRGQGKASDEDVDAGRGAVKK
jgi:hypothetical protein